MRGLRRLAERIARRRAALGTAFAPHAQWWVSSDLYVYRQGDPFTLLDRAKDGDRGARKVLAELAVNTLEAFGELPDDLRDFLLWAHRQPDVNVALGRKKQGKGRDRDNERNRKWVAAAIVNFLSIEHDDDGLAYAEAARLLGYASVRTLRAACIAPLRAQRQMQHGRLDAEKVSAILAAAEYLVGHVLADPDKQR